MILLLSLSPSAHQGACLLTKVRSICCRKHRDFFFHAKVTGFALFFSVTLRKELQFKSQGKHVGNYVFHRTEVIFK